MEITSTPCIAICRIDPATGFCIGCGRTSIEIGRWVEMTEPGRVALMAQLPTRFDEIQDLQAARAAYEAQIAARVRTRRRVRA
jgi:uncharacterized protein